MKKRISVVMSIYINDNPQWFLDAVHSLLAQTYLPSEIIIVVDGLISKDLERSLDLIKANPIVKIIRLSENRGLANAMNVGISNASHELIARMDSDDVCLDYRFELQVKALTLYSLDIVGGQVIEFGRDFNDRISRKVLPVMHDELINLMKMRSPFVHPTVIFKKEVFHALNGYDVVIFPEDYDFFVRAYMKGFKFGNIKEEILWFRLGENFSGALRRRWGLAYARKEFRLYWNFYQLGFFSMFDFFKAICIKTSTRLLPFILFKYIFLNLSAVRQNEN